MFAGVANTPHLATFSYLCLCLVIQNRLYVIGSLSHDEDKTQEKAVTFTFSGFKIGFLNLYIPDTYEASLCVCIYKNKSHFHCLPSHAPFTSLFLI